MKKDFKELDLQDLRWIQKGGWGREYELREPDGSVVARLIRPRWWSSYAEIDAPGNRWSFDRKGFWRRRVEIQSLGTGDQPATFAYGINTGVLTFSDGRVYHWKKSNLWGSKWAWVTPDGTPVIGFENRGVFRYQGEMSLAPNWTEITSMALLVFLGWYLVALFYEDAAAGAVVVTAG